MFVLKVNILNTQMTTKEEVLQWPNIHYFSVKKMMDNNSYYKGKLYKN